jgi:formate dehydrogenase major subunit
VIEAKARGAGGHIDPRFTRTSALATGVPLRAGSDIAFLGGMINTSSPTSWTSQIRHRIHQRVVRRRNYGDTEDLEGCSAATSTRPRHTVRRPGTTIDKREERAGQDQHGSGGADRGADDVPADPTLQHPRCVYQILKRHYARYTPDMVERVCGVPAEQFLQIAKAWTENSCRERTTALVYSVGWTQHSVGAQYIRAGAIIQLLLGNIGRPGGGVVALRGHASIQGSTDVPTLFDLLPGYLPMPKAGEASLADYLDRITGDEQKGFWRNADTYMVSLLKEYWGENATAENDYCFDYVPRINGDHGTYRTVMDMVDGKVFGYFLLGQNPAVGSAHGRLQRLGMANLDWLVVRDLVEIESASFWKEGPEVETGEISPQTCRTEVFLFPAASHVEKAGTFTQTQRMLQWREKAVEPPGDARSELWFFYHLGRILREKLAGSTDERDRPLLDLWWDYEMEGDEPSSEDVLRRISGVDLTTGRAVDNYISLKADGSTICGCWIYSGVYADEVNQAARRKPHDGSEWGWTWPMNRRVLYNRASADPQGRPWSERKKLVWWDPDKGEWTGSTCGLQEPSRRTTARRRARWVSRRCVATTRSSCRPTARAGCSRPTACSTVRCPRTTSRTSRRSAMRCTYSRATRRAECMGGRTIRRTPRRRSYTGRCSRSCSPPRG